jgi:hypothetical protein
MPKPIFTPSYRGGWDPEFQGLSRHRQRPLAVPASLGRHYVSLKARSMQDTTTELPRLSRKRGAQRLAMVDRFGTRVRLCYPVDLVLGSMVLSFRNVILSLCHVMDTIECEPALICHICLWLSRTCVPETPCPAGILSFKHEVPPAPNICPMPCQANIVPCSRESISSS